MTEHANRSTVISEEAGPLGSALFFYIRLLTRLRPSGALTRYFNVCKLGSSHENRKLLISGNCEASNPISGTPSTEINFS